MNKEIKTLQINGLRPVRLFLFVFTLSMLSLKGRGQLVYAKSDIAAIKKNRKKAAIGFQTSDRRVLYNAGLFFESIYKKYKDSSLRAALRCYQASVFSEGELYDDSFKAAFRLGQLYEAGIGIPVNFDKAAAYYLISGEKGKTNVYKIIKKICPSDAVLHGFKDTSLDSVVIRFHPFCQLQHPETMALLNSLASYLRDNPNLAVTMTIAAPEEFITAYYEYWKRALAFERVSGQVKQLLVDRGVSMDRFSPLLIETTDVNAPFTLIIHLTDSN